MKTWIGRMLTVAIVGLSTALPSDTAVAAQQAGGGTTHHVPGAFATIQAAIDAAKDGDTVLVAPGEYREGLRLAGKSIKLVSQFHTTGDKKFVQSTILDGTLPTGAGDDGGRDQVILVEKTAGPEAEIVGFTIRNGDDGIRCEARIRIAHNYFTRNDDAIDYEGGGGLCEHNKFEKNTDDAVDYDLDCDATVVHNEIIDNDDDGIEIRLQPYRGKTLVLTMTNNIITGNREDGIQIIDYPGMSDRRIRIERNLIANNAMSGIGCMADANSDEDYSGADIPEPIEVVGNTINDNEYGITGGDNLVAINNIVAGNKRLGMKKVDGKSLAAHNLFWNNGTDHEASNVRLEETIFADPRLDRQHRLAGGSPCVDAGVRETAGPNGTVKVAPQSYQGAAPDLGAFEHEGN